MIQKGLVITLPHKDGVGVIIDSTRMKDRWYKVTVLCTDGYVVTCRLKSRLKKTDKADFFFRSYSKYDYSLIPAILASNDFTRL